MQQWFNLSLRVFIQFTYDLWMSWKTYLHGNHGSRITSSYLLHVLSPPPLSSLSLWGSPSFELRTLIGYYPIAINQSEITSCHITSSTFCPLPGPFHHFFLFLPAISPFLNVPFPHPFLSPSSVSLPIPLFILTLNFPFFPFPLPSIFHSITAFFFSSHLALSSCPRHFLHFLQSSILPLASYPTPYPLIPM